MSTQRRLFFGPLAAFVIVTLLVGMLYAPTGLAYAESDHGKGKGNTNTNTNHNSNTNNNGNQNNNGEKDDNKGKGKGGEQDDDNKCKKHKYDSTCDLKKPDVTITSPANHSTIPGAIPVSVTITGTASDSGSGIKDVKVTVEGHHYTVSTTSGPWSLTVSLHKGPHTITATATDNAHNIARTHVTVKVV